MTSSVGSSADENRHQTSRASSMSEPTVPPVSVLHSAAGHSCVTDSWAWTSCVPPNRVNTFWGWSASRGSTSSPSPASGGRRPVSSAGTAVGVVGEIDVALRYHVDCSASSAKAGHSSASTSLFSSSSERVGSSSNTSSTMSVGVVMSSCAASAVPSANTSPEAGDRKRKLAANRIGAMAR